MPKETNRTLLLAAKKAASIATMASMLSSMLNLGLILPVKAQTYIEANEWRGATGLLQSTSALASLTSFINSPYPSSDCAFDQNQNFVCANPAYTNVSYAFGVSADFTIPDGAIAKVKIALNEFHYPPYDGATNETWNPEWYTNGINLSDIDTNFDNGLTVTAAIVDELSIESPNVPDTLIIELTCDDPNEASCVFDAEDGPYTIDLKNSPIIAPGQQGPVMQNFVLTDDDGVLGESKMTINSYYSGLTVSASVDARLTFLVTGENSGVQLGDLTSTDDSSADGCNFGTLLPNTPEVCIWTLNGSTNAANGMQVYVVQDQNMTYPGSGQSISQFLDGTQTLSSAPALWSEPSTADAHLGYTSDDLDVFDSVALGGQPFAGITTMSGASAAATTANTSKVADTATAGELTAKYANKIETTTRLEQAPASLGQSYGHTQYFVVVGNF